MLYEQRYRLSDIISLKPVQDETAPPGAPRDRWLVNLEADIDSVSTDQRWDGPHADRNAVLRFVTFDGALVDELRMGATYTATLNRIP